MADSYIVTSVCMLVAKLPVPHVDSVKEVCEDCKGQVWLDKRIKADLYNGKKASCICVECLVIREKAPDSV